MENEKLLVYLRPMMEVTKTASSVDEVSAVTEAVLEELKERMWNEVWKECIDLPQAKVEVRSIPGGGFQITAKI